MLEQYNSIFIVGIKGVAMANLARIFHQMGKNVSGSDIAESFITDEYLLKNDIKVITSFATEDLPTDVNLVVYSAAHGGTTNPQIQEALKRGLKVMHQAEIIAGLMKEFKTSIAVCGCHGKTTTSGLLAYSLYKLGKNPSYLVGTSSINDLPSGNYGNKDLFVVEADEYGINPPQDKTPKLEFFHPTHILCTNIDFDHPDIYKDLDHTKKVFLNFFKSNQQQHKKTIFLCADDSNSMDVAKEIDKEAYLTYGFSQSADLQIVNVINNEEITTFQVKNNTMNNLGDFPVGDTKMYSISLFGEKNVSNATGVILVLLSLGFAPHDIELAIKDFTGAKRRFEKIAKINDSYLFDDYAHHPQEIAVTLDAAKIRFPDRRIVVIFQPHTFSRTDALKYDFVEAFSHADEAYILPIFPSAREKAEIYTISARTLEEIAREKGFMHIYALENKESLLQRAATDLKKRDVIFLMGAGDVYKLKDQLISLLERLNS